MTTTVTNGHRGNGHRGGTRQAPRVELHAHESEANVLGSALLAPHALEWLQANLREGDFDLPAHRTVYATMAQLASDGAPVDVSTVRAAMQHEGVLADAGGAPWLHSLIADVPTPANVGYYGRTVHTLAKLRRLRDFATRVYARAEEAGADPDHAVAEAQALLDELARDGEEIGLRPPDLLDAVRERARARAAGAFASWGIARLDRLTKGLAPGNLILLAALTSTGKSSLAIQCAAHNADARHVAYVTYEMTAADTGQHTMAFTSGHSLDEVEAFLDAEGLKGARTMHNALDLTVYTHHPDAARLLHEVRSAHVRAPLGLVVVDYVQQIPPVEGRRYGTREEQVAEASRLLKALAIRCDVPVLACAQLNRGAVGRQPGLGDLRESGKLEADADQVLFLHRPAPDAHVVDAILAKNRMGPTGETRLAWHARQAMFDDIR